MNEELVFILNQINTFTPELGRCFKGTLKPGTEYCADIECINCVLNTAAIDLMYVRKILTLPLNFK